MTGTEKRKPTVGILFPGEMGSSFGNLLSTGGFDVVTTTEGRSARTVRLSRESGLTVLDSIGQVLQRSDILISMVTPDAALQVAHRVASVPRGSSRRLLCIDANSISPMTAVQVAEIVRTAGMEFLDASIFGLASRLQQRGVLYVSGSRATEIARHFAPLMRVKVVGDKPGTASALKMIVSAVPKSIAALFIETMLFAREMGLLSEATESWNELYPGVMEVVMRLLPTYTQHAERRRQELQEVEQTMWMNDLTPQMVTAAKEVTARLSGHIFDPDRDPAQWSVEQLVEELHRSRALAASESSLAARS